MQLSQFIAWSKFQAATEVGETQVDPSGLAQLRKSEPGVKVTRVCFAEYHRREGYTERAPEIFRKVTLESLAEK